MLQIEQRWICKIKHILYKAIGKSKRPYMTVEQSGLSVGDEMLRLDLRELTEDVANANVLLFCNGRASQI